MPHKGKLSPETKVTIVEGYINGEIAYSSILQEYDIKDSTLYSWVRLYKTFGAESLIPGFRFPKFTEAEKIAIIDEHIKDGRSFRDLCCKYKISSDRVVRRWVEQYNGHVEFKTPNTGGQIYMTKGRSTTLQERIEIVEYCIKNNKDFGKVIEKYQISYQQIYSWTRKYEELGIDGLMDRRGKRKGDDQFSEVDRLRAEKRLLESELNRAKMENALLKKVRDIERGWN